MENYKIAVFASSQYDFENFIKNIYLMEFGKYRTKGKTAEINNIIEKIRTDFGSNIFNYHFYKKYFIYVDQSSKIRGLNICEIIFTDDMKKYKDFLYLYIETTYQLNRRRSNLKVIPINLNDKSEPAFLTALKNSYKPENFEREYLSNPITLEEEEVNKRMPIPPNFNPK